VSRASAQPEERADVSDLLQLISRLVPGAPADHTTEPDASLQELFAPTQFQILRVAAQLLVPDWPGELFDPSTTLADLLDWFDSARDTGRVGYTALDRRSYTTQNVRLRPLTDADTQLLYFSSVEPTVGHRWRFRGSTPSPEIFRRALFDGVLCQFVVTPKDRNDPVGLVSAYDVDLSAGHVHVATQRTMLPNGRRPFPHLALEGTLLFLSYLFEHWPLQKVYFEIPEYNLGLVEGLDGAALDREGRLTNHYYYGGRHWDLYVFALQRARWDELSAPFYAS
jgi:hypothetical protein